MVFFNLIRSWDGGSGCIICHPIRILLGPWLVKVRSSSISGSSLVFDHYCFSAIGLEQIECSGTELVTLQPPSGQSCGSFMAQYISTNGGYLTNPDVTSDCQFCAYRTTDEWMGPNFNIYYKNHWRDFGIFWAYIVFNVRHLLFQLNFFPFSDGTRAQVCLVYLLTYLVRVRSHKRMGAIAKKFTALLDMLKKSS